jgi:hypothetical protein
MRRGERKETVIIPFQCAKVRDGRACPDDTRFRRLLGLEKWNRLPAAVQARFGKLVAPGQTVTYVGEIVECRMSWAGWLLAQLLRLVGGPLPLSRSVWMPATVTVTEDKAGGQFWTRIYGRRRGFPQVIRSSKRFAGPTGLEEYLGYGLGIAFRIDADEASVRFISDHLFVALFGLRLRLPRWVSPGLLTVSHIDCGHGDFAFVLQLERPRLGELISQAAIFHERLDPRDAA